MVSGSGTQIPKEGQVESIHNFKNGKLLKGSKLLRKMEDSFTKTNHKFNMKVSIIVPLLPITKPPDGAFVEFL